jgi:hypothetical protein
VDRHGSVSALVKKRRLAGTHSDFLNATDDDRVATLP